MIVSRRRPINQQASGRILPCRGVQSSFRRFSVKESTFFAAFPVTAATWRSGRPCETASHGLWRIGAAAALAPGPGPIRFAKPRP
jgi:hypothetical protein